MGYIMTVRRRRRPRRFRATLPHLGAYAALWLVLGLTYLLSGSWVLTALAAAFILAFAAARPR